MLKSTAVLCVLSILLCFNLNYTFPYNRWTSKLIILHGNHSNYCKKSNSADRTKKMALNSDNTLKIIDSTVTTTTKAAAAAVVAVPTQSSQRKTNINRKSATKDEDLSYYEQMVIMKKNPYLDLKELEQKLYNPGLKKVRASLAVGAGGAGAGAGVVGICDEGPYVEIVNRGLSGFTIPTKLMKSVVDSEGKPRAGAHAHAHAHAHASPVSVADDMIVDVVITKTEQEDVLLTNLANEIKKFEESKLLLY